MPYVGYDVTTVGLYTRLYFGLHTPKRLYMIHKYGVSITAGGVVSNEGALGHWIEEPHGWTERLDGDELSVSLAHVAGVGRSTVSLAYFTRGQQYFSYTHRPTLWGVLMGDVTLVDTVTPVRLDKTVPQFPVKDLRKGIDVWNAIFS